MNVAARFSALRLNALALTLRGRDNSRISPRGAKMISYVMTHPGAEMAIIPQGGPLKVTNGSANFPDVRSMTGNPLTRPLTLLDTRLGFMAAMVATLLVAFWLRVWRLGTYDLWLDEAISFFVANRPPLEVIAYSAQNILEHPPGYYLLLHFWMQLAGSGETALRLFSAIGGTLCVALVIMLVRRWFGHRMSALVGLLFCIQPLAVTLSRDARMYTWYGAAVLLMVYLFDRALQDGRALRWLLFGAAALTALTFNYLAAFVLLALAVFAVVQRRAMGRRVAPFALVLLVLLGLPLLWIVTTPGPRGSVLQLLADLRVPWSPGRLVGLYFGWPLSGAADDGATPLLVTLAGLRWLLVIVGILAMGQPRLWQRRTLQRLLALLVFIPPLAASFVFIIVKQRYFSALLGFFVLAVVLGLAACWRRSRVLGAVLAVLLVLMDGQASIAQGQGGYRPFSPPMGYIMARAREGEPVIYTDPWDKYLDLYYDSRQLATEFIPTGDEPITEAAAEEHARRILGSTRSVWLVVYPSKLKPETVVAGFDRAGFPGERVWFTGSRGVGRYFAARPMVEHSSGVTWGDDIRLVRWWTSGAEVAAGDALRLQFEWQKLTPPDQTEQAAAEKPSSLISLTLVGEDGETWAARVAAPCNGACSPADWYTKPGQERQGFYIPLDTPPGRYELQLAWLTPHGQSMLARTGTDEVQQSTYRLMGVRVTPPTDETGPEAPLAQQSGMQTTDGGLTLISFTPPQGPAPVGSPVSLPMQWQVHTPQPLLEARLELARDGQVWSLTQPLGPAWHPSDQWMPGRIVRVQPEFRLPGTLAPGEYAASLTLKRAGAPESMLSLALGLLVVKDRERLFAMPNIGEAAEVEWQEGIQLARVAAPQTAKAGETIPVTLIWRADRPTAGNWKIFIHLADAMGTMQAQGDGYPQGGAALTPTWQAGEVIVDTHQISLPSDLPEGTYQLRIGFYNEETNERLPLSPGVDTFIWPKSITITRP